MNNKFADLHIHTNHSDGLWSVEKVIKESAERGFSVISITDHDTVSGIAEAIEIARDYDLEVIPGVEISSYYLNEDVHILGYFVDWKNPNFVKKLEKMLKVREKRAQKILDALKELGLEISYERVAEIAKGSPIGRPHIAQAMVEKGYVNSIEESFSKYIGDGGPAYYPKILYTPSDVISIIKQYCGISVLAHPHRLEQSMIDEIIDAGIDGIEVFYPDYDQTLINRFKSIAEQRNLLITGGSDCHGGLKGKIYLGEVKLPIKYVEDLKNHAASCCIISV